MEQDLLQTLTKLAERMKWVILIGGFLIVTLFGGYAYQVNINMAHAEMIKINQQAIQSHFDIVNPLHELLMEKWINK